MQTFHSYVSSKVAQYHHSLLVCIFNIYKFRTYFYKSHFFPNIQVIKSNIQLIFKYEGMGHEDSDASVIHLGGSLSVVQEYICIYFILTSTYCVENSYNFFININSFNTSRKWILSSSLFLHMRKLKQRISNLLEITQCTGGPPRIQA